MKAILYVVAILAIAGAAYFTLEHSRKFKELQEVRIQTINKNKAVTANADVKENELKDEKEVLATSQTSREEKNQSISALKSTGSTLEREVSEIDSTIQGQDEEFAELEKTLEQVNVILAGLGGNVTLDTLPEKIEEIEEDKKTRTAKVEDLAGLIASAEKALSKNRAIVDRLVKRSIERNSRIGRNSAESVITAVNQDWGFFVIGAGSNSGFAPQGTLIVKRGGSLIGRATPSAIEPTQTIAEIDFDSLATGVQIQPGDRVILAKPITN